MTDCEPGTTKTENGITYECIEGAWIALSPFVPPSGQPPKVLVTVNTPEDWDDAIRRPDIRAALEDPSSRLVISVEARQAAGSDAE
jgi:hypothetical protein